MKKFKKNARLITPSVDNDSIQRRHSISSDDIPSPPCQAPKPDTSNCYIESCIAHELLVHSSTSLDTVHNVLQEHHAKNRHPHTSDPTTLQKLHQQTVKELSDGEEDEEPQAVQPCKRLCPAVFLNR